MIQGIFGLAALIGIAWTMSETRWKVRFRDIPVRLAVQFIVAAIIIRVSVFKEFFHLLSKVALSLEEATQAGTSFVFGYLGGGALPFDEKTPGSSFIFALQALPLVLVISALSSLLFYWRILPIVVKTFAWFLQKTTNIGGVVGVSAAANVFLGMIESTLFIRPYLKEMSRSELFITMTCGMAGIAGTVMVLYANILQHVVPDVMGHVLTASIISIPAAIMISQIMIPETGRTTSGEIVKPQLAANSMDAITKGTLEGIHLLINIISMLIVLIAFVYLANKALSLLPDLGNQPITLQRILGYLMSPVVWLMGIPWKEAFTAGSLMGTKTILNEFIAYIDLAKLPDEVLSPKSKMIMTYALCGFANFGSVGIMIGGVGRMIPERRDEVVSLGMKSLVAGTLSTCTTGALVGIVCNF
ncbi:MAG: nucleoside:proton symporter [Candidatus Brocadia sp. UTAMX2]|jgi:CNT family concentrative nucleoside transporter|nr:MAG: nucleoside:proton symporter [Candidatus Brocadia sp. UTAMX2]